MSVMTTTEKTTSTFSFNLPSERLHELQSKITTLNKKAAKYSIPAITYVLGTEIVVETDDQRFLRTPVVITFSPIIVAGGWSFKASIEHEVINGKNKNVVSGYEISKDDEIKFRECPSECEHCKVKRQRNLTYIVKSAAGEPRQIGSSCLKEYLGVSVEAAVMSLNIHSTLSQLDDEECGFGRGGSIQLDSIEEVVAMTLAVVSKHGWMSQAKAAMSFKDITTKDLVYKYLHPTPYDKERLYPTKEQKELADSIIARWDSSLSDKFENSNDILDSFQYKVAFTVALGWVKPKIFSIIVAATHRESNIIQEEKKPTQDMDEFVPACAQKDKVILDLIMCKITKIPGDYGTVSVMTFKDLDGRKVVWFAASDIDENEWKVGSTFKIKCTIKDFKNDTRFGKQTIITRAKRI